MYIQNEVCTPTFIIIITIVIGHRCVAKGCGETIVIDGNMKNHRDVCFATDAGFVEYAGLPGKVKTGCTNTPDLKSRYCGLHKPTATVNNSETSKNLSTRNQVGLILSKRSTRAQIHYQVCIHCIYNIYTTQFTTVLHI